MRLTWFFLIGSAFMDIVFPGDRSRCVAISLCFVSSDRSKGFNGDGDPVCQIPLLYSTTKHGMGVVSSIHSVWTIGVRGANSQTVVSAQTPSSDAGREST
jgi:hypothetical protein